MLKDFVLNATLLFSSFTIMGQLFKNRPLKISSPLSTKLYWSIGYGILGNILMLFSIKINATIIADLRHLVIVIAAVFGGMIPALFSSLIIALGRILLFGFSESSIIAAFGVLLTGIICGCISKLTFRPALKAFVMNLCGLMIISIIIAIKIDDLAILKKVLIIHYLISLIGGFIAYLLALYVANLNEAQRKLKHSVIKLEESEQKLQAANELLNRLSYMDGLTGISNRRYFDELLQKEWSSAKNVPLSLLMFDIDFFKKYNDTYGHLAGDQCLKIISQEVSNKLTTNLTLCRYGGEEFALILPDTDLNEAMKVAQSIQETIQSLKIPHESSEVSDFVTLSIGIATCLPDSTSKPDELIQSADSALYFSKTNGRNTISIEQMNGRLRSI
jgi:diguanylate cyclase